MDGVPLLRTDASVFNAKSWADRPPTLQYSHRPAHKSSSCKTPTSMAPLAPVNDRHAVTTRMILSDTHKQLEDFSKRLLDVEETIQGSARAITTVKDLFAEDRETMMKEFVKLFNRVQNDIQKSIGTPSQASQAEELITNLSQSSSRMDAIDRRVDGLQMVRIRAVHSFLTVHPLGPLPCTDQYALQSLQTALQSLQSIQEQQTHLATSVAPLHPLMQSLPLHTDVARGAVTAIVKDEVARLSQNFDAQLSYLKGEISAEIRTALDAQCLSLEKRAAPSRLPPEAEDARHLLQDDAEQPSPKKKRRLGHNNSISPFLPTGSASASPRQIRRDSARDPLMPRADILNAPASPPSLVGTAPFSVSPRRAALTANHVSLSFDSQEPLKSLPDTARPLLSVDPEAASFPSPSAPHLFLALPANNIMDQRLLAHTSTGGQPETQLGSALTTAPPSPVVIRAPTSTPTTPPEPAHPSRSSHTLHPSRAAARPPIPTSIASSRAPTLGLGPGRVSSHTRAVAATQIKPDSSAVSTTLLEDASPSPGQTYMTRRPLGLFGAVASPPPTDAPDVTVMGAATSAPVSASGTTKPMSLRERRALAREESVQLCDPPSLTRTTSGLKVSDSDRTMPADVIINGGGDGGGGVGDGDRGEADGSSGSGPSLEDIDWMFDL